MANSGNAPKHRGAGMRAGWWAPAGTALLAVLAWGPAEGLARQDVPGSTAARSTAVRAQVRLEALTTYEDGPTGLQRLESRTILATGGEAVTFLAAGDREAPALCDAGFSPERPATPAYYLWRFDAHLVAASASRTTVAISWTRWRRDETEASWTRTISLEPGDYHILDYVPAPAGTPARCANLVVRLTADPVPQDDPQPELIYDLWLSQEGRLGPRWSHRQVRGRSTDLVNFTLSPLAWSVVGVSLPETADSEAVRLGVKGAVRATLDPSGFVDVSVKADRTLNWCGRGRWDGGRQDYRARLGEAVALILPDPASTTELPVAACPDAAVPAVQLKSDGAVIDYGRFFSGGHTSLTIVISRDQPKSGRSGAR